MSVRERVRAMVERALPWYEPRAEARRAKRSRAVHRFSIKARIAAERAIAADRLASYGRVRLG